MVAVRGVDVEVSVVSHCRYYITCPPRVGTVVVFLVGQGQKCAVLSNLSFKYDTILQYVEHILALLSVMAQV